MYNVSYTLQKQLVEENNEYSIDTILQNLKDNIDTLKESWHATAQIITNGNGNANLAHILSVTINKYNKAFDNMGNSLGTYKTKDSLIS